MSQNLFEIKNLIFQESIYYPDLQIPEHKVTFIEGKSGSGKSTLLKLLNGTVTQSSGYILYQGRDTLELDVIQLRREISLVGQSVFLFDKSIQENFREFYQYREVPLPEEKN